MSAQLSRQTLHHRKRDVERLQLLAGWSAQVEVDERGAFIITRVGGQPLYTARRYEVAAAWLAGYETGLRWGGRV